MALIGNGMRLSQNPMRMMGGAQNFTVNTVNQPLTNNIFTGWADVDNKSSIFAGNRHPNTYKMAMKNGGMSSRNATEVTFSGTALIVGGRNGEGSATITFTPTATGGLIVSGSGSASITFTPTGSVIAVASGSGSATITFTPTANIGALAGLTGTSSIVFTPAAISYAIGYMSGQSTTENEFSATNLASAVWDAVASSYNTAGTMGEKMNDAGSASNPWTEVIESGFTAAEILRILAAVLAGKVSGAGTGTEVFRDITDTKDRVTSTVDDDGNRTVVVLDGT